MLGIMRAFAVVLVCFLAFVNAEDFCYKDVNRACKQTANKQTVNAIQNCDAKYGAIETVLPDLQRYVTSHITRSFEYLLLSTHYGNYEKNREGFQKLFKSLSDEKWDASIDLIKYLTKRGGKMDWTQHIKVPEGQYEIYELQALAKALDMEKELAVEAHNIHQEATRKRPEYHDPEISDHLEHEFVHKQRDNVRALAGYAADLIKILDGPDSSIGLYLFDEYLQKQ